MAPEYITSFKKIPQHLVLFFFFCIRTSTGEENMPSVLNVTNLFLVRLGRNHSFTSHRRKL